MKKIAIEIQEITKRMSACLKEILSPSGVVTAIPINTFPGVPMTVEDSKKGEYNNRDKKWMEIGTAGVKGSNHPRATEGMKIIKESII